MVTSERERMELCGGMIELKHDRMANARATKKFKPENKDEVSAYVWQARKANRQAVRLWYRHDERE